MPLGDRIYRLLPYCNLLIGTSALCFQIGVLYPWHQQLDDDFEDLKRDHREKLFQYHQYKLKALEKIEEDLTDLKTQQERLLAEKLNAKTKGKGEKPNPKSSPDPDPKSSPNPKLC